MLIHLIALLSGGLYAFAWPNFLNEGFFFLSPIALMTMVMVLERLTKTRSRVLAVLLHQTGFNLIGFYWVPGTLEEFGGLPPGASHLVSLFLAPVLNPAWWGWLVWLSYRNRLPGVLDWTKGMHAFFGAVFLTAVEVILPQQFPVYAGHLWMHFSEWLTLASVGGVALYSFFTWWFVLGLAPLLQRHPPAKSALVAALVFAGIHFILPAWQITPEKKSLNIRVVQANVGNFLKIQSENGDDGAVEDVVTRYQRLTLKEEPQNLDLIIWPETAYPFSMSTPQIKAGVDTPPTIFRDLIARTGAEILIGGYDHDERNPWGDHFETEYNAAFLFGSQGELKEVYRKHILIPFGETMPFGPMNRTLSKMLPAVSFFAAGKATPTFITKSGASFTTPICYEILQSPFVAKLLNEAPVLPDFIVNLTNDSWYGKTAEPRQHLFLAKWRALEFRRPIVRSTNTGITTVIYPDGRVGRQLLTGEQDVLDFNLELPLKADHTIYQRFGMLPLLGLWGLLAVAFILSWWLKIRPSKGHATLRRL
ncbi:MAG: apolipoprotein N-acyltransferase [Bacteriovoracia bacterium]